MDGQCTNYELLELLVDPLQRVLRALVVDLQVRDLLKYFLLSLQLRFLHRVHLLVQLVVVQELHLDLGFQVRQLLDLRVHLMVVVLQILLDILDILDAFRRSLVSGNR